MEQKEAVNWQELHHDVVRHLLRDHLDARSAAALVITCRRFRRIGKEVVQERLVHELRDFLQKHPRTQDSPFGGAGMMEALTYIDMWMLQEALKFLAAENPGAGEQIHMLLWEYLLPARAWLNCRTFCNVCIEWAGKMVQLEDMQMSSNWEPLPAVVFLILCIFEFYLPRLLGRREPADLGLLSLFDHVDSGRPANIMNVIGCGMEKLGQSTTSSLDSAMFASLRKIHPVRQIASAVTVIHELYQGYQERLTEPEIFGENLAETMSSGGFYESKVDRRVHWLPVEHLRTWLEETKMDDDDKSPFESLRKMEDPSFDSALGSPIVKFKMSRTQREAKVRGPVVTNLENRFSGVEHAPKDSDSKKMILQEGEVPWKHSLRCEVELQMEKSERAIAKLGEDETLLSFLYFDEGTPYVNSGGSAHALDLVHPSMLRFMLGSFGIVASFGIARGIGWK
jgi:hypothetical protein